MDQISVRSLPENLFTEICKRSVPDPDRDLTEILQASVMIIYRSHPDLTKMPLRCVCDFSHIFV